VRPARARLLVFGPFQPPEVACGISSAARAFAGSRVREDYDIELVSTFRPHRERSLPERLAFGAWLLARSALRVLRSGAVLADVHAVSDRSLLSHAAVMFGARLAGRPALLRIHGGDFDRVFERAGGLHRRLIGFILRGATRVVVLSEVWRSRVQAIEPRAAVEVVPNSVDCRALEALSDRPARECRRILFLANFCERKGHFDALEALAMLVPRFPDVRLALGGEDRDAGTRARLEQEAHRLGVQRNLEFLGIVSGESKERALREADILILPSHTENMPVSVIEGMAAGLPVIATRVGAVGEMLRDGETGFLIEARDAGALAERLARLLSDAALARRLGRNAQRHARATWDAEVVAERNLALYATVA
jgi:glycosyltransferase involved in cell wall biosynthesis